MGLPDSTSFRGAAARLLRDLIHERTGIYYDANQLDTMTGKLAELMAEQGIDSPVDYYYRLKYEENGSSDWASLLNTISVRETYFWREVDQVRAAVEVVMPSLARSGQPVRVWSAACASGEEPVSIAMMLDRQGWFDRARIEIVASDMSTAALEAAEKGVYRQRALRNLPADLRERYFTAENGEWRIDPGLQQRICWRRANLARRHEIEDLAQSQIIFCRNAFIYFSDDAIRTVIGVFAEAMPRPGYLFLGAAESLLKYNTRFRLEEIGGAFVYVKE